MQHALILAKRVELPPHTHEHRRTAAPTPERKLSKNNKKEKNVK
jgi:hypothetical protein